MTPRRIAKALATFGAIPPDVIAARVELPAFVCESLTHAFMHASADEQLKRLLSNLFGSHAEFKRGTPDGYLEFCRATMKASQDGLLQEEEKK